jgi:hypothetical protein
MTTRCSTRASTPPTTRFGRVTGTFGRLGTGPADHQSTAYLACRSTTHPHQRPQSRSTATTYHAFDEPSYDAPLQIAGPGEHLPAPMHARRLRQADRCSRAAAPGSTPPRADQRVRQSVAQRTFLYDAHQRSVQEPSNPMPGSPVIDYDAAGNLVLEAPAGQATLTSTSDCQRTSVPDDGTLDSTHYDGRSTACSAVDHPVGHRRRRLHLPWQ